MNFVEILDYYWTCVSLRLFGSGNIGDFVDKKCLLLIFRNSWDKVTFPENKMGLYWLSRTSISYLIRVESPNSSNNFKSPPFLNRLQQWPNIQGRMNRSFITPPQWVIHSEQRSLHISWTSLISRREINWTGVLKTGLWLSRWLPGNNRSPGLINGPVNHWNLSFFGNLRQIQVQYCKNTGLYLSSRDGLTLEM